LNIGKLLIKEWKGRILSGSDRWTFSVCSKWREKTKSL